MFSAAPVRTLPDSPCVASCPSGALYKRDEDGIVLVDQERCRGWRYCVSGCPYKKVYFNWKTGRAEKCIFCYPRIESGLTTLCAHSCVGRIRYVGVVLYDADRIPRARPSPPTRMSTPPISICFSIPTIRPRRERPPPRVFRERDRSGRPVADLRAAQGLAAGPAPSPRIPDAADGLVHSAAEPHQSSGGAYRPSDLIDRLRIP